MSRPAAVAGAVLLALGALLVSGLVNVGGGGGPVRVQEERPVTAMDQGIGWANNSPSLVADPEDSRFVVLANRLDAPSFSCALQVSGDGGRSWVQAAPLRAVPPPAERCYAPEAAFDRDGTLHYLFVGLAGRGNEPVGAWITSSSDGARTWSEPRKVLGEYSFGVRMAIDPDMGDVGRMHLVWIRASDPPSGGFGPPPNPIMAAHSDDGGRTFSAPVQVNEGRRERVVGPALTLGPDHAVHVAYYDLQDDAIDYQGLEGNVWEGTWSIVVASSYDGGTRFGTGVVVDDRIRPHERVILIFTMPPPALVAGEDGRLCAAWTDAQLGDADAVLRCSTDREATWGDLRRLNDDRRGNGRTQYLPRLSMAPNGRLDAVFYDRRADEANVRNEVFYTFSSDGGRSFARNQRLTSDPSSSLIGQEYTNASARGLVEFGARIAALSHDGEVVAAWADTRNSRLGSTGQDIFATVVDLPAGDDQPAWARVVGGLLVAGGVGCLVLSLAVSPRSRRPEGLDGEI